MHHLLKIIIFLLLALSTSAKAQQLFSSEMLDIPIYKISWHFDFKEENEKCTIHKVSTAVTIDPLNTTPSLEINYNIEKYKESQMQRGFKIAQEIENALKAMPSLNNCKLSASKANQLARNIINDYHSKNN